MSKPNKEYCAVCCGWVYGECENCDITIWSWEQWQEYKKELASRIAEWQQQTKEAKQLKENDHE